MSLKTQIMAVILGILFCLFLGWKANTIYSGYLNQKVLLQQEAVQETIRQSQANIAKQFEEQKQALTDIANSNKSTTTRIIQNNQPIYSQKCIDEPGIDQLKKYKEQSK